MAPATGYRGVTVYVKEHKLFFIVISVAVALISAVWPIVKDEIRLQFYSHLNSSHQAQENVRLEKEIEDAQKKMKRCQQCENDVELHAKENARLVNEVDKLRTEIEEMRERMKQCLDDVDTEHSMANRSYWYGVNATMLYIALIAAIVLCCCFYWCCREDSLVYSRRFYSAINN